MSHTGARRSRCCCSPWRRWRCPRRRSPPTCRGRRRRPAPHSRSTASRSPSDYHRLGRRRRRYAVPHHPRRCYLEGAEFQDHPDALRHHLHRHLQRLGRGRPRHHRPHHQRRRHLGAPDLRHHSDSPRRSLRQRHAQAGPWAARGTLLRTTNGGATWTAVTLSSRRHPLRRRLCRPVHLLGQRAAEASCATRPTVASPGRPVPRRQVHLQRRRLLQHHALSGSPAAAAPSASAPTAAPPGSVRAPAVARLCTRSSRSTAAASGSPAPPAPCALTVNGGTSWAGEATGTTQIAVRDRLARHPTAGAVGGGGTILSYSPDTPFPPPPPPASRPHDHSGWANAAVTVTLTPTDVGTRRRGRHLLHRRRRSAEDLHGSLLRLRPRQPPRHLLVGRRCRQHRERQVRLHQHRHSPRRLWAATPTARGTRPTSPCTSAAGDTGGSGVGLHASTAPPAPPT